MRSAVQDVVDESRSKALGPTGVSRRVHWRGPTLMDSQDPDRETERNLTVCKLQRAWHWHRDCPKPPRAKKSELPAFSHLAPKCGEGRSSNHVVFFLQESVRSSALFPDATHKWTRELVRTWSDETHVTHCRNSYVIKCEQSYFLSHLARPKDLVADQSQTCEYCCFEHCSTHSKSELFVFPSPRLHRILNKWMSHSNSDLFPATHCSSRVNRGMIFWWERVRR